jgi:FAD synthase
MELVRGLHNISQRHAGCVLTVGNYDGVHLGHQQMIGVLKARAANWLGGHGAGIRAEFQGIHRS